MDAALRTSFWTRWKCTLESEGLEWVYLDSYDDLKAAIAVYEKRGYARCERYNENPQATVFMRKNIAG